MGASREVTTMADILRITMGKRMRVEIDGKDETFYIETEAAYQPGELPIGDTLAAVNGLADKVDNGMAVWTKGAPATKTTAERKGPSPVSEKQKNFIRSLMKQAGATETEIENALEDTLTSLDASNFIKELQVGKIKYREVPK